MRLMVSRIESTWSWLALIWSALRAPVLALWLTRLVSWVSRLLTSLRPPSAVPMTLPAWPALSMACCRPACWFLRFSLAIRPAGSSLPLLIFKPVLSRWRLVFRLAWFCARVRCAISDVTLVLILPIGLSLHDQ